MRTLDDACAVDAGRSLEKILRGVAAPAIAVSGGVDSLTLAAFAAECAADVRMLHAVSPAVPPLATERVRALAAERGWHLTLLDAGEFADPLYRANPVNRCFHCKTNLYATIRGCTDRPILSGANLDDLAEYRPGLDAAANYGVRHPYIDAGIDKPGVRTIARALGLAEVAELPASPCLSSRVETGIRIEPETLGFIDTVERLVTAALGPTTVRCRVRASAVVIELDAGALARLDADSARSLRELLAGVAHRPASRPIRFAPYRNGSAFLREATLP
jgi:uncharacterized protein